ncbi:MAG: DUF5856 family protein [Tannerellaceae bacterium]|nr:DUF5856 family protein [Tannerellaceae bacterium]
MATTTKTAQQQGIQTSSNQEVSTFIGELFSFNNALKLFHWHITGPGSYAQHIALDQALETVGEVLDRITETTYAHQGEVNITIPATSTPQDIVKYTTDFYNYIESHRDLFPEDYQQSILDDYQEAIQQLLYRLIRLK